MKLLSGRKSQRILQLPQDYASNIFTQEQSFNCPTNFNLLFPLMESEVPFFFFLKHAASIQLPITTIITTTVNLENYY